MQKYLQKKNAKNTCRKKFSFCSSLLFLTARVCKYLEICAQSSKILIVINGVDDLRIYQQ